MTAGQPPAGGVPSGTVSVAASLTPSVAEVIATVSRENAAALPVPSSAARVASAATSCGFADQHHGAEG